jgi:predicted kinase
MKTLYLLCAPAFAGKSTLARAMAERLGCAVVSFDALVAELGLPPAGEGLPPEALAAVHRAALARAAAAMAAGGDLVIDDTHCFRFLRDDYRRLAGRRDYRTRVVHLDVPAVELRRRRVRNEVTAERDGVNAEVFERHLASFEPPIDDEDVLVLRPEDRLDEWLDTHLGGRR